MEPVYITASYCASVCRNQSVVLFAQYSCALCVQIIFASRVNNSSNIHPHLVFDVKRALPHNKLHHQLTTLQGQVVMVGHCNYHLTQDTANLANNYVYIRTV